MSSSNTSKCDAIWGHWADKTPSNTHTHTQRFTRPQNNIMRIIHVPSNQCDGTQHLRCIPSTQTRQKSAFIRWISDHKEGNREQCVSRKSFKRSTTAGLWMCVWSLGHRLNVLLESPNKHMPSMLTPEIFLSHSPMCSCGSQTPKPSERHLMTAHASLKCCVSVCKNSQCVLVGQPCWALHKNLNLV